MRIIQLSNGCPLKGGTMGARLALLAVLVVALLFACSGPAFSQISVAQLSGFVHDSSGGAVKNATVTLRDTATDAVYRTTSNDSGLYVIPNLPPDSYELTIALPGFVTTVKKGAPLSAASSTSSPNPAATSYMAPYTTTCRTMPPTRALFSSLRPTPMFFAKINSVPHWAVPSRKTRYFSSPITKASAVPNLPPFPAYSIKISI